MLHKIGLILNARRHQAVDLADRLSRWLIDKGIEVTLLEEEAAQVLEASCLPLEGPCVGSHDMVIALGGDGTFLRAARLTAPSNIPILGINLGHLGFLSEIEESAVFSDLKKVLAGDYIVDERMMLQAQLVRKGEVIYQFYGLNDVVLHKGALSRLLQMNVWVGEEFSSCYKADGLIVASPTGSTAYSLSAGGPVVHPELEVMVLTPICPHTLNGRPMIVPASSNVTIEVSNVSSEVMLTVDGQTGFGLVNKDQILITRAPFKAAFIRIHPQRFFTVLRNKFGIAEQFVDE